jgi:hypothetical protein
MLPGHHRDKSIVTCYARTSEVSVQQCAPDEKATNDETNEHFDKPDFGQLGESPHGGGGEGFQADRAADESRAQPIPIIPPAIAEVAVQRCGEYRTHDPLAIPNEVRQGLARRCRGDGHPPLE